MEAETSNANHMPDVRNQFLAAVFPMLLISVGYVDPGKWAAVVEGGARFGFDLVVPMLVFNFAAAFFQYLSAQIGIVTGRDFAQICSDEYDKSTCMLLGIQTELSMIALDLTMILGIAHGLNLMLGVDLFSCVFLTAIGAVLFPLFATLLENGKARFICIWMVGLVLCCYVVGVLIGQPEIPLSLNGMPTKYSGESAFALMTLLGATIMPHNFYLHSSIVQQHPRPPNVSVAAFCHSHFCAILLVFSGIFLLNYLLMNAAANVFYSTGLVLLTFQDALSLLDQVFRSPVAPIFLLLVLCLSNQITALTWDLGGQVVLHNLLRMDIPGWLHHATIRIIAVIPALYFVRTSGAEGVYQLLLLIQVINSMFLPSSVIPLYWVASSRPIMGAYKISQFVEFLFIVAIGGMFSLKIIFVVEMIFGNSDWVGNLRWNMGNTTSASYVFLLATACTSFCFMIWLAVTPLKSASARSDAQAWDWESPNAMTEIPTNREEIDFLGPGYHEEDPVHKQEPAPALDESFEGHSDMAVADFDLDLPETIIDSDQGPILNAIKENCSNITFPSSSICKSGKLESTIESVSQTIMVNEVSHVDLLDSTFKIESVEPVEKTVGVEGDSQIEKDDEEGDTWEPEEASKGISGSSPSLTSEGPGSFRSLSGKSDEGGNGTGSLSRLAGLGRAARRQLAAVLDEFWGQLYDFHGNPTQEAKAKKLGLLLGLDSKPAISSMKVDSLEKDFTGHFPSAGGRGSDSLFSSSLYESPRQQTLRSSMESSCRGVQRGSTSIWTNNMQMLDPSYMQNSSRSVLDASERRYSSLRLPPSSDGFDYQPATVHGYPIISYLSRNVKDRTSNYLNPPIESTPPKSPTLGPANYRDPVSFALGQKLNNGVGSVQGSGFQNLAVLRNSALQSDRAYYEMGSSGPAETGGIPANTKKFHSLPDMSGLSVPLRDLYLSDRSAQWDGTLGFGPSVGGTTYDRQSMGRTTYEQSLYSNTGSTSRGYVAYDELSPSKAFREPFSLPLSTSSDTRSLWSRQPYEQFGLADKTSGAVGEGVGSQPNPITRDAASYPDWEAKLLQSFRHCIVKLIKLEGSDWLFRPNEGADEDLIYRVAAREKFLYEAETREMNWGGNMGDAQYSTSDRKYVSSVPHCGEGCVWRVDLIISFGVWCIHRILDLSFMESRPELWGKYTYVLNRLQGIIDLAFSKPRTPKPPCFCLKIPASLQQRSSPPVSNGILPAAVKSVKGKCTSAAMLLDIIKDVEIAISCRKGRTGTAAGDVAFPKGKENLASVLKRYKRRLSNKPVGSHDNMGSGLLRKYGS